MPTLDWQKSSYCGEGDACLNIAAHRGSVKLTESSDSGGAILTTTPAIWSVLLHALKENRV